MADGPVANLQAYAGHLDAVAGYVNRSGIGATYLPMCLAFPDLHHLSITTSADPLYAKAQVGDCEAGALTVEQALAHPVFYGSWATVNTLTSRPPKLWVAHVNSQLGQHICGASVCGCRWEADGTQWAQNVAPGIDLSILADDFFVGLEPAPAPSPLTNRRPTDMLVVKDENGTQFVYSAGTKLYVHNEGDSADWRTATGQGQTIPTVPQADLLKVPSVGVLAPNYSA